MGQIVDTTETVLRLIPFKYIFIINFDIFEPPKFVRKTRKIIVIVIYGEGGMRNLIWNDHFSKSSPQSTNNSTLDMKQPQYFPHRYKSPSNIRKPTHRPRICGEF